MNRTWEPMETLTAPALDSEISSAARPVAELPDEAVAEHHTAERRQKLAKMAVTPIRWAAAAYQWIDGDPDAIDAYRRLLIRLDRYQDVTAPTVSTNLDPWPATC